MDTIDTIAAPNCPEASARPQEAAVSLARWPLRLFSWLNGRIDKRRSRIALSELTDDQLRDIGLTRREANTEAHRPFWD